MSAETKSLGLALLTSLAIVVTAASVPSLLLL